MRFGFVIRDARISYYSKALKELVILDQEPLVGTVKLKYMTRNGWTIFSDSHPLVLVSPKVIYIKGTSDFNSCLLPTKVAKEVEAALLDFMANYKEEAR
jgi:hypothetical protein